MVRKYPSEFSVYSGIPQIESSVWVAIAFEKINSIENKYGAFLDKTLLNIIKSANADGGWGSWKDDRSRIIVTSLVLLLLRRINSIGTKENLETIFKTGCDFLIKSQNQDGGWGFRPYESSNGVATSYALAALAGSQEFESSVLKGLEWAESEKRKYYSSKIFFKHESIWRETGIHRWSYFVLPLLTHAFTLNNKTFEIFKDLKYLLDIQQSDGSWIDTDEPYLTFHTYLTTYFLSDLRERLNLQQFEKYCDAIKIIQKDEFESLLSANRNKLKRIILEEALKISKEGFLLSSGKKSTYLYDLKKVLLDPTSISIIGKIIWELIKHEELNAIGGPETGAIPIATAVVRESYESNKNIQAFFVRKEPKKHGTKHWIEGNLNYGDKVIVLEDVVTTGGSLLKAISKLEEYNCKILKVFCIVDREEGAAEKFSTLGIKFESLFKHSDFKIIL